MIDILQAACQSIVYDEAATYPHRSNNNEVKKDEHLYPKPECATGRLPIAYAIG